MPGSEAEEEGELIQVGSIKVPTVDSGDSFLPGLPENCTECPVGLSAGTCGLVSMICDELAISASQIPL